MRSTALKVRSLPAGVLILAGLLAILKGWLLASTQFSLTVRLSAGVVLLAAILACVYCYILLTQQEAARQQALFEEKIRAGEERLRQAQKMEAVGQLAGGIAHDFNNLVTVIGCSVGLLAEDTSPGDPRQEDLNQIKEATDRAATLTRQLLAFSRRQILQPKLIDLNAVVRDMEKMLQRVLGPHINIRVSQDPKIGHVLADIGQVEQVIMNLAVNARDAMPDGGTLTFETKSKIFESEERHEHGTIAPGEYVSLSVRDTGEGMPPDVLEHLFEPFYTTKEYGKGTGLGLATVHGIVYQSNGHITVASAPGRGTMFTLYFPRVAKTQPETRKQGMASTGELPATPPPGTTRLPAPSPTSGPDTRPSVVIVDDEDAIRDIGTRVLQQAGYRVSSANHGEEAIALLAHYRDSGMPVSLVLTDVAMPMMNGSELAAVIATNYPETRVLCMSGYSKDELVQQRLIDAHMAVVHKPFELSALLTAVRNALPQNAAQPR